MILFVIGGSASGKSEYAENRITALHREERLIYLATMMPFGEEAYERIERHRALRTGKGFETVERYTDLLGLCEGESEEAKAFQVKAKDATILLECMSNLTANEMFGSGGVKQPKLVENQLMAGVRALAQLAKNLVIISIDVFGDGRIYDDGTEQYRQCLGHINQSIAKMADEVVEVVYSIPVTHQNGGEKCSR